MFCMWVTLVFYLHLIFTDGYDISTTPCVEQGQVLQKGDDCEYSCTVTDIQPGDYISVEKPTGAHYRLIGMFMSWTNGPTIFTSTSGLNPELEKTGRYSGRAHVSGNGVTIQISDAQPEDSGNFSCCVYSVNNVKKAESSNSYIPVEGADVVPFFALQNDDRRIIEVYRDGGEVSLTATEMENFAFMVNVSGSVPLQPSAKTIAKYVESDTEEDITKAFEMTEEEARVSYEGSTGFIKNAYIRESYEKLPLKVFNRGQLRLTGAYRFASQDYNSSVTVSLLFAPSQLICDEVTPVLVDDEVKISCKFAANPGVTSFGLILPNGEMINNTIADERFVFDVSYAGGWMYNFNLTYSKMSADDFGQHVLIAKNYYGQTRYQYVISDANEYNVLTTSCVDNGQSINKGDTCEYSCVASGLRSAETIFIAKKYFAHYELFTKSEVNETVITFDSIFGLNPALNDTGRYKATIETIRPVLVKRATISISDVIAGDSGGYDCYISNGTDIVASSDQSYIPVLGAEILTFFMMNDEPLEQQINITENNLENLVFVVNVTNAVPVPPTANITAFFPSVDTTEEVISLFHHEAKDSAFEMDDQGFVKVAHVQETFTHPPTNGISKRQGLVTLTGQYEYSQLRHSVYLEINILFEPDDLECTEPLPVLSGSDVKVECTFIANPEMEALSLLLPDGQIITSDNNDHGVTFTITKGKIDWHYNMDIKYQQLSSDHFGIHNLTISNELGNQKAAYVIRDLASFGVQTTSCVDEGSPLQQGEDCEYSCRVQGLGPEDTFTISRVSVEHYTLTAMWISRQIFIQYDSIKGLNPDLPERYKAIEYAAKSGASLNITKLIPGDSAQFVCYISDKYGREFKRSTETFLIVYGSEIGTSISNGELEVNLTKEEVITLDYTVSINGPIPVTPSASIMVLYSSGFQEDVKSKFVLRDLLPSTVLVSRLTGIITTASGVNIFETPDASIIRTDKGKPVLVGTFEYADYHATTNASINLLFAPDILCEHSYSAVIGNPLTINCTLYTNPPAHYSALQLPTGQIIDHTMSNEGISLQVSPGEVEWMFTFNVTYEHITEINMGQHKLNITNVYGETSSSFQITEFAESTRPPPITTPNKANNLALSCLTINLCTIILHLSYCI